MSTLDPMDAAVTEAENSSHVFGRMSVDAQYVIWEKGQRIRPWFEGDPIENRTSQLTFRMNPLDLTGMTKMIEKQAIAIFSDWTRIIWPSLRNFGYKTPRELEGRWAHAELVPKQKDSTYTTFKFLEVFDTEAELIQAYEKLHGSQGGQREAGSAPGVESMSNDAEKKVAEQFLPSLIKMANGDLQALATNLATMQPVCKYFTIDSPEVQALLKAA